MALIELHNVSKNYITRLGVITKALDNISLRLPNKGLVFILGKSGSGKSTLLNIMGGLDTVNSGKVIVNGRDIHDLDQRELDYYRNAHVGFVFQDFNIIDTFTISQNIGLAVELQGHQINNEHLGSILDYVGLSGYESRKGNEVSGGQKQRIAIARALIKKPTIILADEPTGNLDSSTSNQIMELLKKVSRDNLVVIVSHDPEEAELYADRIIRIKDGMIFEDHILNEDLSESRSYELIQPKLSFISSWKYGIHSLTNKKAQLIITNFIISICLLFTLLLGAYLYFLMISSSSFYAVYGQDKIIKMTQDLQGYLSLKNAEILLIGMYFGLISILYVFLSMSISMRRKQIGIFKALGASTVDVLRIFVWEGLLIGVISFVLSTLMGFAYIVDINKKFFDGLALFELNYGQLVFNLGLLVCIPVALTIGLTLYLIKKNSVISILKEV
ncbi:MAG: ATP-binding cassette domain-containing protein [Erysipelotrichaceae bacterium]|nr:ATP-binding cassette domain-containing protein [Erysipelotrichaceae bacterium]